MSTIPASDTVRFTTKGQVVIPLRLRKQYHIEEGTKAVIEATPEGILLKPVTLHSIHRLRGILKRPAGAPALAEEWAEHKRDEKTLEDRRHGRRPGA